MDHPVQFNHIIGIYMVLVSSFLHDQYSFQLVEKNKALLHRFRPFRSRLTLSIPSQVRVSIAMVCHDITLQPLFLSLCSLSLF